MGSNDFVMVPVHVSNLTAVFALLAGTSILSAVATGNVAAVATPATEPSPSVENVGTATTTVAAVSSEASDMAGKTDAAGTLFDPARHTGSIVKSGLWRMKAGMSRGPGEGEDSPNYVNPNGTPVAGATSTAAATTAPVEEDEFAAFRAAATPTPAPAARSWTDADLSKLCNQAALKAGGPDGVKAVIAKYVPAGAPQHSRSIPAENREAFAVEIETSHGITFEG